MIKKGSSREAFGLAKDITLVVRRCHRTGDNAHRAATSAKTRKEQRAHEAINKAPRAAATGGEALLLLAESIRKSLINGGKADKQQAIDAITETLRIASDLVGDMEFEAAVLIAYRAEKKKN